MFFPNSPMNPKRHSVPGVFTVGIATLAATTHALPLPGAAGVETPMPVGSCLLWAFVLRLAVVGLYFSFYPRTWLYTRAPELATLACSLAHGRGLYSPFGGATGPTAFLAPGYPALIALIFRLLGSYSFAAVLAILALQTLFGTLTVGAMMLTAHTLFGLRVARFAGLAGALGGLLLFVPAIFWETSLSTLLLIGMMALAVWCAGQPTSWRWTLLGLWGGVALLVNPALALAMLGLLGWTAYQTRRSRPSAWRGPLLGLLLGCAVLAPWPIRNARVLHHFIPFRSNLGFELWMGNQAGRDGDFDVSLFPIENQREHAAYAAQGEVAYMSEKAALAQVYIRAHPAVFARTTAQRVLWFWSGAGGSTTAWLGVIQATATSLLGLSGLWVLARRHRAAAVLFLIPLLLFPLPYYVTHADLRFRLVLDPLLLVLAAVLAAHLVDRSRRSPRARRAGPLRWLWALKTPVVAPIGD